MKRILFLMAVIPAILSCGNAKKTATGKEICDNGAEEFTFQVFKNVFLSEKDGEALVSPLSLSWALSMAESGADGSTAAEMRSVLGFEGDSRQLSDSCKKLMDALETTDKETVFEIANSIWADEGIDIRDSFTANASDYFDSEVFIRAFNNPATVGEINFWCSEKTHGKISSIVDRLDSRTRMMLINALYFNGKWETPFPFSRQEDFNALDGSVSRVEMMHHTTHFSYAENEVFQILEMPYGNGAFTMLVLLPHRDLSLRDAVSGLSSKSLTTLTGSMKRCEVAVSFPEFRMEYEKELSDILAEMGMVEAFSNKADFGRMSGSSLCIGSVKQKTFIDVSKEGTEAAAVTAIGMKATSLGPKDIRTFRANRPFIFLIREKNTSAIAFIGTKVR